MFLFEKNITLSFTDVLKNDAAAAYSSGSSNNGNATTGLIKVEQACHSGLIQGQPPWRPGYHAHLKATKCTFDGSIVYTSVRPYKGDV